MRILFVTDLHGSTLVLHKAIHALQQYDADVFLLGGDLSGKYLLPLVSNGEHCEIFEPLPKAANFQDGNATFDSNPEIIFRPRSISRADMPFHLQRLEAKGYYWHECRSQDEAVALIGNPERYADLEQQYIFDRLCNWANIINNSIGEDRVCYWTGGNDDDPEMLDKFRSRENGAFLYAEGKCISIDESVNLLSLGVSNPTPFRTSREMQEEELLRSLQQIYDSADRSKGLILNVHVPPKDCGNLDLCEFKGKRVHVGSTAVRTFVEQVRPIADFAGHVHEGKGVGKIGRTVVFNPGSDWNAGILQGFVVVLADDKIIDYTHLTE